jgi:hypothetical protein
MLHKAQRHPAAAYCQQSITRLYISLQREHDLPFFTDYLLVEGALL